MNCVVCDAELPAPAPVGRPRRYCSAACRQRAYHARQLAEQPIYPPENAIDANVMAQNAPVTPPQLLTAIVLVPLDCEGLVFAAHSFAEFPWYQLLAQLGETSADITSSDMRIAPDEGDVLHGFDS